MAGRARVMKPRLTLAGEKRYDVKYRLGGQGWPEQRAGSFTTKRDAELRRDALNGIIATASTPAEALRRVSQLLARRPPERVPAQRVAAVAEAMLEGALQLEESTRRTRRTYLKRVKAAAIGELDAHAVTVEDVQEFVAGQAEQLAPSTLRNVVGFLAAALDYARVAPNPVRDRHVRLPKLVRAEHRIATWAEVETIAARIAPRRHATYALVVQLLEALGIRVGELVGLTWGDIDWTRGRVRISIARTKTAGGQRWLCVPDELLAKVADLVPPDERAHDARVFSGITEKTVENAMRKACERAKIAVYSPHDLRHRRSSLWSAQGTPPALLSRRIGHADVALTQKVYSHVVAPDDDVWADFWRSALARGE